jgi:hypothetical protein
MKIEELYQIPFSLSFLEIAKLIKNVYDWPVLMPAFRSFITILDGWGAMQLEITPSRTSVF